MSIIERVRLGTWRLISSEAITVELERMRNLEKKASILELLALATQMQEIDTEVDLRAQQLEGFGFGLFDAFHLACAEAAQANAFLSTDDRLLKTALRHQENLHVEVGNPVVWFINQLQA